MRASSLQRYALCPGSWALEQQAEVPELPEPEICESGTAIHAVLAGSPIRELTPDEEDLVEQCRDEESTILSDFGDTPPGEVIMEEQMVLPTKPIPISGHPDKVLYYKDRKEAVVLDWKLGWMEVTKSDRNLQLRKYVLATKMKFPDVVSILAAIVQPRVRGGSVVTIYSKEDLLPAWHEVSAIVKKAAGATLDDLQPSPEACRYCPVKAVCPAVRREIESFSSQEMACNWETLPAATKVGLWDKMKLVKTAISDLEAHFRADLEKDPDAFGGELVFTKGRKIRSVTDPVGAYQAVAQEGVSADDFAGCCKVGLEKLKDKVRAATGLKGKALTDKVNQLLEPFTTINEARPSIERRDPES